MSALFPNYLTLTLTITYNLALFITSGVPKMEKASEIVLANQFSVYGEGLLFNDQLASTHTLTLYSL